MTALVPALDPAVRDPLWNLRRAAMPLLYGMPGDRKPVTFVEDTAVAPARLPEFVARFREMLQQHGTDGAFYGHASVGCLHIRPLLNLKDPADVARDAAHHRGGDRPGPGVRRLAQRRARRRPGPQRVERQDVRRRSSTRPSARSSRRSIRTTCSTPARSSMRRR